LEPVSSWGDLKNAFREDDVDEKVVEGGGCADDLKNGYI
jgi:hypothetical protein